MMTVAETKLKTNNSSSRDKGGKDFIELLPPEGGKVITEEWRRTKTDSYLSLYNPLT